MISAALSAIAIVGAFKFPKNPKSSLSKIRKPEATEGIIDESTTLKFWTPRTWQFELTTVIESLGWLKKDDMMLLDWFLSCYLVSEGSEEVWWWTIRSTFEKISSLATKNIKYFKKKTAFFTKLFKKCLVWFNPGTHILGPDPVSAYFGLYLYFNAVQSSRDLVFMGLKFVEDLIFLVK